MKRLVKHAAIILMLLCGAAFVGCKEDPMSKGRAAHALERADEAEAAFKEVLAQNPDDFDARRLMADVHRFRGDFARSEQELEKLWDEKGFDDESKDLPPEELGRRDLLKGQRIELYTKWAEELEGKDDEETFVRVVRKGLELHPKSPTFNRQLVEHFTAKAEAAEKAGDELAAAEAYEEILKLRIMPDTRKNAREKASTLRKAAFTEAAKKRFEESVKAELVENEQWMEEGERVAFVVEARVDRRLRQNREADLATAREEAAPALRAGLATMVAKVTGLTPEEAVALNVPVDSSDESLRRGSYEVRISFPISEAFDAAFQRAEKQREAAEADEKPAEGADAPEGGADAGTPADGDAGTP